MALTVRQKRARNAAYQARWRARREALARGNPEVAERELPAVPALSWRARRLSGSSRRCPDYDSAIGDAECECSGCGRWFDLHPFLRRAKA